ncbi:MAG TPA: ATP-binding protein, partial [Actinomycetota bacterium]|nr:ATP-binding protein [Actinomycetota bacterium]
HDLRTPLASITASATGLLDSWEALDPNQRRELLVTIDEEAGRLNRLVGNLLDLARMRAGALTPSPEPAGVDEVVEAVIARLRPILEPFNVRTVIRPNLPDAWIDPMMIDQVVTNLLENAARFSPPGSEISVTVASFQGGIEVRIADQGPGIPEDERQQVFEPFVRRDAGRGRGGTGLGLAIARAIVVAHGGRISIEGAPGGGTVVVFRLPVDRSPAAVQAGP